MLYYSKKKVLITKKNYKQKKLEQFHGLFWEKTYKSRIQIQEGIF